MSGGLSGDTSLIATFSRYFSSIVLRVFCYFLVIGALQNVFVMMIMMMMMTIMSETICFSEPWCSTAIHYSNVVVLWVLDISLADIIFLNQSLLFDR